MAIDNPQTEPSVLTKLAHRLGTEVKNRRLEIPEKFGKGYCTGFVFNEHIRMMIMDYELHEDLILENPDTDTRGRMILFKFQNVISKPKTGSTAAPRQSPSVLITTSSMNADTVIPVHTHTATINIEVDAHYLNGLFDPSEKSVVLQSLLQNTQPLLFEQMIYPALQNIVDEILSGSMDKTFELFLTRIKAEELVCKLLMELKRRNEKRLYDLNPHDVQTLYQVKEKMLEHLDTPPVIAELAALANMSPSKLKHLFKQIFGNSIFSYYQECRMTEAARLLKEKKLSVTEVGYQMGFTNLSHFSKIFREHIGMKPKQYSTLS